MISSQFTGGLNLAGMHAGSQQDIPVVAGDVEYDPTASGLLATNVQDAIDELSATTLSPMEPTSLGLAYGKQDSGAAFSAYGYDSAPSGAFSLSVFNRNVDNDPQLAPLSFSCIVQNNSHDDADTDLRAATVMINDSRIAAAKMLDCTGVISRLEANTIDLSGACVVGDMRRMNTSQAVSSVILKSTFDNPEEITFNTNTLGCVYIGNQRAPLTIGDGHFVSGEYQRFFLRYLNSGSTPWSVYYDTATGELTWNTAPGAVASKRPLTEGKSFGYANTSCKSEICGLGTLDQHEAAAPAALNNVTSIGHQNLAGLNVAIPVTDTMIIGSSLTANSLSSSLRQTFIATNQATLTTTTGGTSNVIIAPRANAINTGTVAALSSLVAITTNTLTLPSGAGTARSKGLVFSNGPVTMGQWGNIVMCSSGASVSFPQQNSNTLGGNMVFLAGPIGTNYDVPTVRTGCIMFHNDDTALPMYPTRDNQFVCSATSLRINLAGGVAFALTNALVNYKPLIFDASSREVNYVPYNNGVGDPAGSFGSRKMVRRSPVVEITPGVLSTASFDLPQSPLMNASEFALAAFQLTVRVLAPTNAVNTKSYNAQVQDINTATRVLTANVYETDTATSLIKNATGNLEVALIMSF